MLYTRRPHHAPIYLFGLFLGERAKDDVTQNLGDQKEKTVKEALKQGNGSVSKKISDQENKGQTLPPGAENGQSRSKGGSQLSMSDHKSSYGQKDGNVEEAQASLDSTAASCNIVRGSGEAAAVGGGAPSSSDGEVDGAAAAGSRNVGGAAAAGSRNVGGDERAPIEEPENPLEGVVAQRDNSLPSLTTPPIQEERPETETADPTQNRTLEGGEEDLRNEETVTQGNRYEQLHSKLLIDN